MTKSKGNVMRLVASVLYAVLFVFQLLMLLPMMEYGAIASLPIVWMAELGITLLAAGMAVYLFSSSAPVKEGVRKGAIAATVLGIVFELIFMNAQITMFNMMFAQVAGQSNEWFLFSASSIVQYVLIFVRIVLAILAAFFVISAAGKGEEKPEDGGDVLVMEVDETLIVADADEAQAVAKDMACADNAIEEMLDSMGEAVVEAGEPKA